MQVHSSAIISKNAYIDPSVKIGPNVIIEDNVRIHAGVKLMAGVYVFSGTEIGEGTVIHPGAIIGNIPQDLSYSGKETFTKIGRNNIIRENVTIHRGTKAGSSTIIGDNNYLMVQSHLGHNCRIHNNVIIANGALLAGHVEVEDSVFISGNAVFHQFCRIGRLAMIGGFSGVNKDVPPYMMIRGPAVVRGLNLVGMKRAGFSREIIKEIRKAYRILYISGETKDKSLQKLRESFSSEEVKHLVAFIEASKRGICHSRNSNEKDIK
jgi:UDP-N-acetylglucosamine acyltransferase